MQVAVDNRILGAPKGLEMREGDEATVFPDAYGGRQGFVWGSDNWERHVSPAGCPPLGSQTKFVNFLLDEPVSAQNPTNDRGCLASRTG